MATLACRGGQPVRTEPFPGWPVWDDKEREALLGVLESGKWWYGEKIREFEEKFAAFQDAKYGVLTSTGTAALEASLLALGIGAGDEVIVPPYTFLATASAVLTVNAVPIFVDIDANSTNIDPELIEPAITDKTKAIIPVHFGGYVADMDRINEIARKHNLHVIEDACHSWGSRWNGKGTGALGDCGVFSFQMSKNITSAEGGILLTDDEAIAETSRSYTNCGRGKGSPWYTHFVVGGNLRLTEFQASILLAQLTRLEQQTLTRQENAEFLNAELEKIDGIITQKNDPRMTRRAYHLYMLRYDRDAFGGPTREQFLEALTAEGVPASSGYAHPLYKNPVFQRPIADGPESCPLSCPFYGRKVDYNAMPCPVCERLCTEEAIWIEHPVLLGTRNDMEDIVAAFRKVRDNVAELLA